MRDALKRREGDGGLVGQVLKQLPMQETPAVHFFVGGKGMFGRCWKLFFWRDIGSLVFLFVLLGVLFFKRYLTTFFFSLRFLGIGTKNKVILVGRSILAFKGGLAVKI